MHQMSLVLAQVMAGVFAARQSSVLVVHGDHKVT